MAVRGFLSGVFWGGVVSVLGLGVVSQMAPMQGAKKPVAPTETAALATPEPAPAPSKTPEPVADKPSAPALDAAPTEPAKTPESVATAEVKPAVAPLPTTKPEPVAPPAPTDTKPAVKVEPAAPIVAPAKPAVDAPAPKAASTDPAALGAADTAPPAPKLPVITAETPAKPADPNRAAAPEADQQPAAAELPPVPPLTAEEQAVLDQTPEPEPEPAPPVVSEAAPEIAPAAETPPPAAPVKPATDPAKTPEVTVLAPVTTPEPTEPLPPTPGLSNTADGVTVGRLPSISADPKPEIEPEAESGAGSDETTEASAELLPVIDQTPLQQFASPFENPESKPLFAIILIDTGGPNVDRKALAQLPFPVTFAIDPAAADAATAAAIYRDAGQEVMMLATGIPQGATAADLEVTFQANATALPEAVAVLDLEDGGFQNERLLATEVVPVVKDQGRGIVTWDKGLNAGDQVARREGVASAMVFRRLDGANENASTVRRYLDRAAFKAAQDGMVTVVGETSADTVAVLMEWAVEGRSASVALAPISAVLAKP